MPLSVSVSAPSIGSCSAKREGLLPQLAIALFIERH